MAQQTIFRHPIRERLFECVYVVESLAGVDALPKKILIYIGGRGSVWIDSGVAGKDSRKRRSGRAFQRDADARLQDCVAMFDALSFLIEARLAERMNGRADQTTSRLARQLCVGVKRDHIAHLPQQLTLPGGHYKTGVCRAAQQSIELAQLSTLA